MNIKEHINRIYAQGYSEANAEAKLCQDIILELLSKSSLNQNVTIKGSVVMRSISDNVRRTTQDIDIDFIRYSLEENSIRTFLDKLNEAGSGEITLAIVGDIEELKQQDYHGKRIHVEITDTTGIKLMSKIDLGVHKRLEITQEEYCFDIGFNKEEASLLINSKEQILTEKLRSILRFGSYSRRYKDIYDIYYLLGSIDNEKLEHCLDLYIYQDNKMRENNKEDIYKRVYETLTDTSYLKKLNTSKRNWLDVSNNEVVSGIIQALQEL